MRNKTILCICIFIFITCYLSAQSSELEEQKFYPQIRYNVDILYEYFTLDDVIYPIAPLFKEDDIDLMNILSDFEYSRASTIEYSKNISISRILSYCSLPIATTGGLMCAYQIFNPETSEYIYTTGLITLLSGCAIEMISTIFHQKAKSHLADAVWEYNVNINN